MKNDKIKINISIDNPTLLVIDEAAKIHRMSQTGLLVYSTLRYIKEMKKKDSEELF